MKAYQGLYSQNSMGRMPTHNPVYSSAAPTSKQNQKLSLLRSNNLKKNQPLISSNKGVELRERLSRSIEDLPQFDSSEKITPLFIDRKTLPVSKAKIDLLENCEETELFRGSFLKLNSIYRNVQSYSGKSEIEEELSQILDLIKEERSTITNKLALLEARTTTPKNMIETAQNTDPILMVSEEIEVQDISVQTDTCFVEDLSNNETYSKLIKILEDMSINSKLILPEEIKTPVQIEKKYQELKDSEIITVQKFVIKKLVQKISSIQECSLQSSGQ